MSTSPRLVRRIWIGLGLMFLALAVWAWALDFFTASGERTVYTAECREGVWQGNLCTGQLVAGDRHRFRALPAHSEVLFWTVGSSAPSGKLEGCKVANGRNWTCPQNPGPVKSVAKSMVLGRLDLELPPGQPGAIHRITKLRWLALNAGIRLGNHSGE